MPKLPAISKRFVHLECARGIAAIIVILHHFCLAFYPGLNGSVMQGGLKGTPLYVLVNGSGAVLFFFTLSGFVLTRSMFKRPSWKTLAASVIKRLPRLMVPVSVSIVAGFLILKYLPGPHLAAAAISHSDWLRSFGNAYLPKGLDPSLGDALRQSLFVFLKNTDFYYNSNLWTMVFEFWGSILVFAIAALYCIPKLRNPAVMVGLHLLLLAVCYVDFVNFAAFVCGSLLAYVNIHLWPEIKLRRVVWGALLLLAAAGFSISARPVVVVAALIIMFVLVYHPAPKAHMTGRMSAFLGRISFPSYLVSTLVILSISSALFVLLAGDAITGPARALAVLLVTLVLSLLTCLPLVVIDTVWLRWLNRLVAAAMRGFVPVLSENDRVTE